jgi:diguanylate cyclase
MAPTTQAKVHDLRYQTYVVVLRLALIAYGLDLLFGLWLEASQLELTLWIVLILCLSFILWQMQKRKTLTRRNELVGYSVITVNILLEFVFGLASNREFLYVLQSVGLWLLVMYAFAFFVFEPKQGLRASFTILGASLLFAVPLAFYRDLSLSDLYMFIKYYCASIFVIIFGYAAARWRQSYEQVRVNAEIAERNALTDLLTHVYNRRGLEGLLERETTRAERYERDLSIILFDLDNFKAVNDTYGHAMGDDILKTVADIARTTLRNGDEVGRWGGEEFMVICPETDVGQACMVAERLREAMEKHPWPAVAVTASFGIARKQEGELLGSLYKRADTALYQAKRAGKNCVKVANVTDAVTTEEVLIG